MVLSMYVSMRGSSLIEYQLPMLLLKWISKMNKNSQECNISRNFVLLFY